jgi:hypothetical protein
MNYYQHPYVSNSDLSRIKQEMKGIDQEYVDAYRIGSLIDAMITEAHKVDYFRMVLVDTDYSYSQEEIELCRAMKAAFMRDQFCQQLLSMCGGQSEMYDQDTLLSFNGLSFTLNTKRKYDLWSDVLGWGGDIKSTTATSQKQFEAACRHFDYDRQRYWYMHPRQIQKDVLIGISKVHPHRVFKVFINAGDDFYRWGERKANELAFYHWSQK